MNPRRLDVCVIGDTGGVHVRTRTLAMAARGYRMCAITPRVGHGGELQERSPHMARFGDRGVLRRFNELAGMLDHYRLVRDCPGDIVHIHYACSLGAWLWLITGCRRPMIVSVMGGDVLFDEQGNLPRLARWMTRLVLRRANIVTAKSDYLVTALIDLGVTEEKIEKVIWGVDPQRFHHSPSGALRTELGLGPADRVILSPRILRPFYNIMAIVEAMPHILERVPRARLIVTEYESDPGYRSRVVSKARELGVDHAVILVGVVPHARMPEYYSLADVAVGIPPSDALPQTLLEALACGTPNVVTRLARYEELLADGETAVFVELEPEAVAAGVLRILEGAELAGRMSDAGVKLVLKVANLPRQLDRVESLYQNLDTAGSVSPVPLWIRLAMAVMLGGLAVQLHRINPMVCK